jgi:hypothetical protein
MNALLLAAVMMSTKDIYVFSQRSGCAPCAQDLAWNGTGDDELRLIRLYDNLPAGVLTPTYYDPATGKRVEGVRTMPQLKAEFGVRTLLGETTDGPVCPKCGKVHAVAAPQKRGRWVTQYWTDKFGRHWYQQVYVDD